MWIGRRMLSAIGLCLTFICSTREQSVYRSTTADPVYFAETFDTSRLDRNWVLSKSLKEDNPGIPRYDGEWRIEEPKNKESAGNKGLVLKSPGRHHAIAAPLHTEFHFTEKLLFFQYEVYFQNGMDCGGGYIKLLSHSDSLHLNQFSDATPYSIMFGPDKCGTTYKIHFIFRHRNPVTGSYEEKHARQPDSDLSEFFSDRRPHLYSLNLFPNNTFEIHVDRMLVKKGSLLEDMDPPVVPAREIQDPNDTKPPHWDDRLRIPDPSVTKPHDWEEEAPHFIPDPSAQKPRGWLEEEEALIPDPQAQIPHDWSVEMDGEWEPPLIANPNCFQAAGCGPWKPPMIPNPIYKGKWKAPMINNPNYQGEWRPRMIPNPLYFEDAEPFRMSPVAAVGFELWSLTADVMFDNILLCEDRELAVRWTEETWTPKQQQDGVIQRLLLAAAKQPWLWGLYVFSVGLPVVLFVSFMWPEKRFGPPDQDYYYKKSDAPQPDSELDPERLMTHTPSEKLTSGPRKRDVSKAQKKSDLEMKFSD